MIKIDAIVQDCYNDKEIFNFVAIADNLENARSAVKNDLSKFGLNGERISFISLEEITNGVHVIFDILDEEDDLSKYNIVYIVKNVPKQQLYGYDDDCKAEYGFDLEEFWDQIGKED